VPTRPTPTFTASFQELGVGKADTYMHQGQFFQLYGVMDRKVVSPQHQAEVRTIIQSILSNDPLECYAKGASLFQCFVNGRDDLALMLLRRGLVVPRSDAPPEYIASGAR
jgi:hypothetical protein